MRFPATFVPAWLRRMLMHASTVERINDTGKAVQIVYEPDGMPIDVPANAVVRVVCRGTRPGAIETAHDRDGTLVFFGWPSSTAKVFVDGALVYDSPHPVPDLPPGMTTRQFLGMILGGNAEGDAGGPGSAR